MSVFLKWPAFQLSILLPKMFAAKVGPVICESILSLVKDSRYLLRSWSKSTLDRATVLFQEDGRQGS